MFDKDKWQEIISTLSQNKMRTALTAFGVFWGIFMMVVMLAAGKGLQNGVFDGMGGLATNSTFIWTKNTSMAYGGYKEDRRYNFNTKDIQVIKQKYPEIKGISPRIQRHENVIRGITIEDYRIYGDYPDYFKIDPVDIITGRLINDMDIKHSRKVIVIGKTVHEEMFKINEDPINKYLQINGAFYKVIGVFKSIHKEGWGEWQNKQIFAPLTTLQKTYNMGDKIHWFGMSAIKGQKISPIEKKVIALLKERHSIHPDDDDAIGRNSLEERFNKFSNMFAAISTLIWIVSIGTLIAGIVGVSNIMLVLIRERTKEIGIKRAIGAKPAVIIKQIILESVLLTFIAGYMGLAFGTFIIELLNKTVFQGNANEKSFFTNPEIDFNIAIISIIILVISGVVAGIIPAKRALRLKPIEALRFET